MFKKILFYMLILLCFTNLFSNIIENKDLEKTVELVFYRPSNLVGILAPIEILINRKIFIMLKDNQYTKIKVKPEELLIYFSTNMLNNEFIKRDVERIIPKENQTYFIEVAIRVFNTPKYKTSKDIKKLVTIEKEMKLNTEIKMISELHL